MIYVFIRTPEEDRGRANYTMDYTVDLATSGVISPHVADVCVEAPTSTYTRHEDVVLWAAAQGRFRICCDVGVRCNFKNHLYL